MRNWVLIVMVSFCFIGMGLGVYSSTNLDVNYKDNLLFIIIIMLSILPCISFMLIVVVNSDRKLSEKKKKFFNSLDKCFSNGQVKGIQDIAILYNSTFRNNVDLPLINLLEDYVVYATEKEANNVVDNEYYKILKEIVEEEYKEKPFANAPNNERQLLINISNSVSNRSLTEEDVNTIQYNLKELSSLLSEKDRIYSKAESTNRWSVPTAIIGIILTILFGIISLFFTKETDYDKIKDNTKTVIEEFYNENPNAENTDKTFRDE